MITKKDDSILRTVAEELESEGITVRESTLYLDNLLAPAGVLTRRKPSKNEWKDIAFGWQLAKEIGRLDIGQTVVVKDLAILAVEAIEARMRRSAAAEGYAKRGRGREDLQAQQDLRFDLPATGLLTISAMQRSSRCLAIEAGKTIMIQKEALIALADQAGIAIVALDANGTIPT